MARPEKETNGGEHLGRGRKSPDGAGGPGEQGLIQ